MAKKTTKKKPSLVAATTIQPIKLDKLLFDEKNPRLAELGAHDGLSDEAIAGLLWRELAADEIVMSIVAAGGFFDHEPLFAEKRAGGSFTVIEGNRRLAAVKLIVDSKLRTKVKASHDAFDEVTPSLKKALAELPVIVTTREKVWQYVGFKHVNGPRPWGAKSKAEYIATVHEEQKVPLDNIARQIGDRHSTVKRLYRGLTVLRQAEKSKVFDVEDRWSKRFSFSHLYTGLDYEGFQDFLGIKESTSYGKAPVPKKNIKKLGEICLWLYGSKSQEARPVIRSQNPDLRNLDTAIQADAGVDALRAGLPLETARDASLGDKRLFRDALVKAKARMEDAQGKCVTGYDKTKELYSMADDIYRLSGNLLDVMDTMRSGRRGRASRGRLAYAVGSQGSAGVCGCNRSRRLD